MSLESIIVLFLIGMLNNKSLSCPLYKTFVHELKNKKSNTKFDAKTENPIKKLKFVIFASLSEITKEYA